jgi:hypothetical protein
MTFRRSSLIAALLVILTLFAAATPASAACPEGWVPTASDPVKCIPRGSFDCGAGRGYCTSPNVCAPTGGCMLAGTTDCGVGRGSCAAGTVCMKFKGCMPVGAVECSDGGYCDPGFVCGGPDKCRRP